MKFSLNNIDAIIFDLGGVILNLDPQKTFDSLASITGFSQLELVEYGKNDIFKQYEKGEITSAEFRIGLGKLFKIDVANETIDDAWNAMLLDLPVNRLEMIGRLRSSFKTFVLSNTNEIHIAAIDEIVTNATNGNCIANYFNEVYFSHKVGMRKPETEIFEMVLSRNSLDKSKTLFIDDTLEHIKSAKKLGLQTWHLTNQEELFTAFDNG